MSEKNRQIGDSSIIGMGLVMGAGLGYAFSPGFADLVGSKALGLGLGVGGGALLGVLIGWVVTHLKR